MRVNGRLKATGWRRSCMPIPGRCPPTNRHIQQLDKGCGSDEQSLLTLKVAGAEIQNVAVDLAHRHNQHERVPPGLGVEDAPHLRRGCARGGANQQRRDYASPLPAGAYASPGKNWHTSCCLERKQAATPAPAEQQASGLPGALVAGRMGATLTSSGHSGPHKKAVIASIEMMNESREA